MRKVIDVTITEDGRDKGKTFVLTEMPASQAEKVGQRMAFAMALAASSGDASRLEALMDEVMRCVQVRPDPARPEIIRPLVEDDIEEIETRVRLRREVAELHTGFFAIESLSNLISVRTSGDSLGTPTSPPS